MTFLPIVERELRVAARRGTTHWARFGLTLVVALIMVNYFVVSGPANPNSIGRSAFVWLLSAAFVLACAACALTADTLSAEHREGTLGLLFLTDLRTWDITLGKLASAGLGAAYAGIAFVPLLMLPLLAGGVSGRESARAGLGLLAIVLFSLAAGLAASARETDRVRALRRAALRMAGTVLLPPLAGWFGGSSPVALIGLLSPLTTLLQAQDTAYGLAPSNFWISMGLQVVHAAWLLVRAGTRLQRHLVEPIAQRPAPTAPKPAPYSVDAFSNVSSAIANPARPRPGRAFDNGRPLEWLVKRQRGQQAACWVAAILLIASTQLNFLIQYVRLFTGGGTTLPLGSYALYQLGWVAEALLAWTACRFFFEARRSGELEVLLSTPVGAQALVSAHWAAMKRLLFWPIALVLIPFLLQGGVACLSLLAHKNAGTANYQFYSAFYTLLRPVQMLLMVLALNWLGMLFALTLRRLISAVALTLGLVMGLSMVIHSLMQSGIRLFIEPSPGSMSWTVLSLSYYPIDYALLLALTYWASRRLRRGPPAELIHLDWQEEARGTLRRLAGLVHAGRS